MRNIKFRVIINNKVVGYEKLEDSVWKSTMISLNPKNFVRWSPVTFSAFKNAVRSQFTGLLDKNGKEIYEGDIVKGKCFSGWDEQPYSFVGQVIFAPHCDYQVRLSDNKGHTPEINDTYKVIGNIFENPELIKK